MKPAPPVTSTFTAPKRTGAQSGAVRAPEYRFLDRWVVPAPLDAVYHAVARPRDYPLWWSRVFLAANGDEGDAAPGKRVDLVSRGYLPYTLRFALTCTAAEPPHRVASVVSGDFEGTGVWTLEAAGGVTVALLDWRPRVTKPGVRELTPLLRPLFRSNHAWGMRRGQEAIVRLLAPGAQ
jgi:hypothetical protein